MAVKDVSQVGHLSLIDGAKRTARPELDNEPDPADKISVTQSSEVAHTITTAQAAASTDRAKVVQALTNAVRQGSYKPDPQRIAQEILEDAELIAKLQTMLKR
jgi:negative regulator of flagellin synthesis FlgM